MSTEAPTMIAEHKQGTTMKKKNHHHHNDRSMLHSNNTNASPSIRLLLLLFRFAFFLVGVASSFDYRIPPSSVAALKQAQLAFEDSNNNNRKHDLPRKDPSKRGGGGGGGVNVSSSSSPNDQESLSSSNNRARHYESSSSSSSCSDIVIIGGGIAGLALVIGLATHLPELTVTLIEKRTSFQPAGATVGFAANGAKALIELSCKDKDDNGAVFVATEIQSHGKDMQAVEGIPVHVLPWWILRDALLKRAKELAAASQGKIQIWNGLDLETFQDNTATDEVELLFANSDCRLTCRQLFIGADGVRSKMRSLLGLPPAIETGVRIWRGHVQVNDCTVDREKQLLVKLFDKGYAPFMLRNGLSYFVVFNHHETIPGLLLWQLGTPLPDDEYTVEQLVNFLMEKSDSSSNTLESKPEEDDDDEEKRLLEALLSNSIGITFTRLSTINMDDLPSQGWGGTGRVTLLGDAAHACRPTDGQGANLALEDACVLVRLLKQRRAQQKDILSATAAADLVLEFENSRLPRVKRIHADQAERALKQGQEWTRWSPEFMKWVYDGV